MSNLTFKGIGILGGTFDPIHFGHTEPAKVVANYLSLNKILFIPTNIPPHKTTPHSSAKQRVDMVTLACKNEDGFYCDQRELERTGNSYTVDTLKSIKQNYPKHSLFFIIGLDSLLTFTRWHKHQEILSLCHLVVNSRPNYQLNQLNKDTKDLLTKHQVNDLTTLNTQAHGGIIFVPEHTAYNISSTQIRAKLTNNQVCQHLVNRDVLSFINKNQLYR